MQDEPPSRRKSRSPAGHLLWLVAAGVAALLAGWLLLQELAPAHGQRGPSHEPRPGVRTAPWKRARDLPRRREDGLALHRATFRTAQRYFGPLPSEEELARYREAGLSGAFYDHLLPGWKEHVDAALAGLHTVLDEVADAVEDAIEEAKRRIRGTEDEFLHRPERSPEENRRAAGAFRAQARAAGDLCFSDSHGGVMRHYRIRRSLHPQVYELRAQDAELNRYRQERLHAETEELFARHGLSVLDAVAMDRAWAQALAAAGRVAR